MPPDLLKAHRALDRAVDAAYGKSAFASEAERVAFLFEQYQALTSLLPEDRPPPRNISNPVQVRLDPLTLRRARQRGGCWLAQGL